jgi:hypothetical protein
MTHCCAVCGRPTEHQLITIWGVSLGFACPGECEGLLWESDFILATGCTEDDRALIKWQWGCRRCDVEGKPRPPPPESESKKVLDDWIRLNGLEEFAKEFE